MLLFLLQKKLLKYKNFSEKYGIPKRSIENWEGGQRSCPPYVEALLERVVKEDIEKERH